MRQPMYDPVLGRWKIQINRDDFLIYHDAGEMVGDIYVSEGADYLVSDIVDMILQSQEKVKELEADNLRLRDMWAKAVSDLSKTAVDNNVGRKWIPVTERLPEKDGRYQVSTHGYSNYGIRHACFAKDARKVDKFDFRCRWKNVWYGYDSEWGHYEIGGVTHWMPLPEPPQEESHA